MTYSDLTNVIMISPNSSVRSGAVDRITIHHMAGDLSIEACGKGFSSASRRASANYGIGSDARVGLYVPEERRSWASSNRANDDRAITIEVANCGGSPNWPVSHDAYGRVLDLCEDICRRYGKTQLLWFPEASARLSYEPGPEEMVMTVHQDFVATLCPGPYLLRKMPSIAAEVTRRLTAANDAEEENMKRYNSTEELPAYGKPTVEKLMSRGVIKGREDGGLDLSEDMLRVLVWNDRAGLYDWQGTKEGQPE